MEEFVYKDIIIQEKEHWWFKARREILRSQLEQLDLPNDIDILEVGCGTGGNLDMLNEYGNIHAIEMDSFAIKNAQKIYPNVKQGELPNNIPFDKKFDLICMFDVLEHIEEDFETIEILRTYLKDDGIMLITVPAYQWLYGTHDKFLHHKRRYMLNNLLPIFKEFKILKKSYFNTFLFPLVVLSRIIDKLSTNKTSMGYATPSKIINKILFLVFKSEKYFLKSLSFPFGSSIILCAKKD